MATDVLQFDEGRKSLNLMITDDQEPGKIIASDFIMNQSDAPKKPEEMGDTTRLYDKVFNALQVLADGQGKRVEYRLETSNQNLIGWANRRGEWTSTQGNEKHILYKKVFSPKKKRE